MTGDGTDAPSPIIPALGTEMLPEDFEILGEITDTETIAVRTSIRELQFLNRQYVTGRWRKRKGFATIRYRDTGRVVFAEIHWYEAHSIGAVKWKVKREIWK
jgi:hypothetical protein